MALFKISKGLSKNLMTNVPYAKEGFAYFTSDDGKFYIDVEGDGTNASPAVIGENRIPLSALSTDWIKATKIEDAEAYPILAFRITDSTKNLIELKYGSIGYKNGTLVIPNVETGNKDEVLIENNDEGSALIIDNKGAGTGIKIINTGEDSLVNNQGININNNILLNMNGSASFNGPVTMGGTNIFVGGPANVLGTNKTNTIISNQLTLQQGAVFGGNAQNAGLVTRGICGISTPTDDGTCEKDNLYINYDGDNSYKASRHVILQAGEAGKDYGNHLYQYAAARGDAVHDWSLNNFYKKSDIDNKLNNLLATNDAMVFKGTIGGDAAATIHELPATHSAGETYRVYDIKGGNNGKYLGNGEVCEIGDLIICIKDGTTHSAGDWTIVQTNIDGAVINTEDSSTDGHIAIFSGNKGRTIKDSGKSFNDLATANHTHTKLVNGQYAVDFNGASLSPINNPQNTIDLGNISNPWKNLYLTSDIQLKDTTGNWETLTEKLDGKSNTGHTHQITANVDTSNSKEGAIIKLEGTGGINAVSYKATHADKGPSMANDVSSITTTSNANKSLAGEFGKTLTLNIPRITIDKQGHVNAVTNDEVPIALPSAPTIGNGKLTIKVGKTPVKVEETFTANQTTDEDIPLPVYTITETDTLLSSKANSSHAHNYAGSSSAGGPATSADKLNTNNVGSETAPVYFKDGIPVVTGLTLDRDISGNAETATIAGKVEHALNISVGGTPKGSYDGSAARTIDVNAADLKISGALVYIGRVATKPTSSQVTLIDGTTITAVAGNVVICTGDKKEYLYDTDGNWVDLGSSTSYALKPHIHGNISSDGYLTNEAGEVQTNSIMYSDADGKITKGPTFDTTNTTKRFLAENGNWEQSSHHTSGSWNGLTYTANSVNNAGELKFTIPTGTGATSVAPGNHNHDKIYKKIQTAVSSPAASNTDISFIDTVSQDTQGKITATKKTVRDASASQSGIVSTGAQTLAGEKTLNDKTHFSKGFDLKTSSGSAQFNANTVSVSNGTDYVDLYVSTISGGNGNKTRPLVLNANANGSGNVGIGITQPTEKLEVNGNVKATQFKGNADTADKWKTTRKLTIGSTGKDVDGSANVNWSLDEIGAAAKSHKHTKSDITDFSHTHDDRYYTESEINDKLKTINDKIGALLGANDALVFKGIIDGEHPLPTTDYEVGHTYRVNAAGTYAGQKCEQGDLIICIADASSTSTPHWTVAQTNIDGAVIGPNTSTANAVPTFANETGKAIKDNPAVTIDNTGLFTAPYIATGLDGSHYFQSAKFRGEGDANTYYHAIDFGYAGHDRVDFHEYGGTWNFYKNTKGTAAGGELIASIKPDGFHGNLKGNADTATTATSATSATTATKITQTVIQDDKEGNYPLLLANNGQTATTTGDTYFDKSVTLDPKTNTITANINGTADKVANNLTIQLNNGTTEGTNKFTYDGSAEKTINITSSSIGAASSSHNHDSSYVKKSGDTMTGDLKFQKTNSDGTTSTTATIGATTGYITGTWLQTTSVGYKAGDFATIDGSGWIYKRTAAQARQDMGLSTAMHFIGKATVDITDGSTVDPKINGYTTKTAGDVIIDKNNSYEYVWTLEGKWERLGPDGSYSVIGHNHDDSYVIKSGDTMSGTLRVLENGIGSDLNNDGVSLANNSILLCSGGYEDYEYFQLGGTSQRPDIFIDRPGNPITLTSSLPRDENIPSEVPALSIRGNNLQNGFTFYIDKLIDPQNSLDTGMGKIWLRSLTNQAVQLKGICGPTEDEDAANKYYVDHQISTKNTNLMSTVSRTYVKKAGDTMSGNLTISHSNTNDASVSVTNSNGSIGLLSSTDRGLYDYTNSKWLIYTDGTKASTSYALYGAVWNDYAEFREGDTIEAGRCVIEVGDDTLITSTERMMPGANITSDTFGFAIGETDQAKTPIAVSGRVLAYPYESREEFKKNIGRPVCSGPNGTVSIMTDEEYRDKGYCAIGTISAVPNYEEWGTGKVKVNGRVWIKVF